MFFLCLSAGTTNRLYSYISKRNKGRGGVMENKGERRIKENRFTRAATRGQLRQNEAEEKNKRCERLKICGNIFLLGLVALISYMVELLMDKIVLSLINNCLPKELKDHIEAAASSIDELFN